MGKRRRGQQESLFTKWLAGCSARQGAQAVRGVDLGSGFVGCPGTTCCSCRRVCRYLFGLTLADGCPACRLSSCGAPLPISLLRRGYQHGITFGRAYTLSDLGKVVWWGRAAPRWDHPLTAGPLPAVRLRPAPGRAPADGLPVDPRPLTPTSPQLNSRPCRAQGL